MWTKELWKPSLKIRRNGLISYLEEESEVEPLHALADIENTFAKTPDEGDEEASDSSIDSLMAFNCSYSLAKAESRNKRDSILSL